MLRIAIAVGLTLLLGPGVGHLYLKRFKRALLLILATIVAAVVLALKISNNIAPDQLNAANSSQLFKSYIIDHPSMMFYFDVLFAALWAYALVDAFMQAYADLPPAQNDENEEQ